MKATNLVELRFAPQVVAVFLFLLSLVLICACSQQPAAERAAKSAADVVNQVYLEREYAEKVTAQLCERGGDPAAPYCHRARRALIDLRIAIQSANLVLAQVDAGLVTVKQIAEATAKVQQAYATVERSRRELESFLNP